MGVQHLRNEKAHTPATPLEPNLAVHYILLASLAYDLITRYVSEDTIKELEDLVLTKRQTTEPRAPSTVTSRVASGCET